MGKKIGRMGKVAAKLGRQCCIVRSGSERRFYDGYDRKVDGSTCTQVSFVRSWIMLHDKSSLLGGT